jgi:hypothetical protein
MMQTKYTKCFFQTIIILVCSLFTLLDNYGEIGRYSDATLDATLTLI